MRHSTLESHLPEEATLRPVLISLLAHGVVLVAVAVAASFLVPTITLVAGAEDGGLGSAIPVSLAGELTGGSGNVRPSLTPAPEAVKPPPAARPDPDQATPLEQFQDPQENDVVPEKLRDVPRAPEPEYSENPSPGAIPSEPLPGVGGAAGGGGGLGTAGLRIGSGRGGPGVASWYIRQLEQRISRNWLRASMGSLNRKVVAQISFVILPGGQIDSVRLLQSSGVSAVDLAGQRAVLASQPLPPLPPELRGRRVEFVAHFEYPPDR